MKVKNTAPVGNIFKKATKTEMFEKWNKTGLLDGLPDKKKSACAKSLEEVTQLLISNSKKLNENADSFNTKLRGTDTPTSYVAATLLPIVCVLYREKINRMPTMKSLFIDYIKFLRGDLESFLVMAYVKKFVSELK